MKFVEVDPDEMEKVMEATSQALSPYSLGFLRIEVHNNEEDALPIGSGTLVSVGTLKGILTAGHVAQQLPAHGQNYPHMAR